MGKTNEMGLSGRQKRGNSPPTGRNSGLMAELLDLAGVRVIFSREMLICSARP
jgi:hypothetical protein